MISAACFPFTSIRMGGFQWNGSFRRYSITQLSTAVAAALSISGMLFKACREIATKSDINDTKKELKQDINDTKKELKQDIKRIENDIKRIDREITGINESHKNLPTLNDIKGLLEGSATSLKSRRSLLKSYVKSLSFEI